MSSELGSVISICIGMLDNVDVEFLILQPMTYLFPFWVFFPFLVDSHWASMCCYFSLFTILYLNLISWSVTATRSCLCYSQDSRMSSFYLLNLIFTYHSNIAGLTTHWERLKMQKPVGTSVTALQAITKNNKPRVTCSNPNCGRTGNIINNCYWKGTSEQSQCSFAFSADGLWFIGIDVAKVGA